MTKNKKDESGSVVNNIRPLGQSTLHGRSAITLTGFNMPKCKEETKMTYFRNTVAVKCGINAAIVAEIIWELHKTEFDKSKTVYHRHRRWCRCSQPMITLICPALSVHMVRDAIKTLAVFMLLALR